MGGIPATLSPVPAGARVSLRARVRRRAGAALVDNFFRGMAVMGRLHPQSRPDRHGVEVRRDIPYRPTGIRAHRLDVYRPIQARGRLPVVLYIHGGGFRILSKDTHWVMALAFARQGYLVFNVSYRLAPRHPFPFGLQDVMAAWHWVLDHAASYGGDPETLVVAGESAGANLATALTLTTCARRSEPWARSVFDRGRVPTAVVPACGILQVSDTLRFARRQPAPSQFIMDRLTEVTENYFVRAPPQRDLADPLVLVERGLDAQRSLPPFFLPVGTLDPLQDDTRRMEIALRKAGVDCEARYYDGELHAFHALVWRKNARRCWRDTFAFLERRLPRPPQPVHARARIPTDRSA
jgi:acetyl esterase